MEASVVAKGDDLVRAKSHPMRGGNASNDRDSLRVLTERFRNALKTSVAGIVEAGQVLIEAKSRIEHGQFTDWVDRELRFGAPQRNHSREANIRQAEMLMLLARHDVISKSCHWHDFPPSIRTLYELTQVDKGRLLKLIKNGKVHGVLDHIRRLKRAKKNLTVQMFEQAVRWAKPQLAKQQGDE
jgi:hypothetical protein